MTNQLASLARRDYFYLDAFWRVNLGMYIIDIYVGSLFGFFCRTVLVLDT